MSSAFWPIQQAIFSRLTADATLMSKIKGVFDAVDENQPFPYVTIGDATSAPFRTFGRFGEDCTITLHIWSRPNPNDSVNNVGFKEALLILNDLNRLLADQVFSVSGYEMVACYYEFSDTLRDPDGITRHIPVRYRIQLQKGA